MKSGKPVLSLSDLGRAFNRPADEAAGTPVATPVRSGGALVYSTDTGRTCPDCRRPVAQCTCRSAQIAPAADGVLRVWRETKGRGGKAVTLIQGLGGDAATLAAQAKQLRSACGSGGTVKDGTIEVQGDHVKRVMAHLQAQGHRVKRAGG